MEMSSSASSGLITGRNGESLLAVVRDHYSLEVHIKSESILAQKQVKMSFIVSCIRGVRFIAGLWDVYNTEPMVFWRMLAPSKWRAED